VTDGLATDNVDVTMSMTCQIIIADCCKLLPM